MKSTITTRTPPQWPFHSGYLGYIRGSLVGGGLSRLYVISVYIYISIYVSIISKTMATILITL